MQANTNTLTIYDPAMCCSTGVCGPEVDPKLVRFSADLDWISKQGVDVRRFNLAQEPGAFAEDVSVKAVLDSQGEAGLPLIKLGDDVVSSGEYPSRDELAALAGLSSTPGLYTDAVAELVAIGAAIASNCEPCFKFHYDKARKLGVSREDMMRAVTTAKNVKETPAQKMLELAERYLSQESEETSAKGSEQSSGCCGSSSETESAEPKKSSCC